MKIVHSIKNLNFSSGGPVRAIIDLSTKLAERGHEVRIITQSDPDAPEQWRSNPEHNPHTVPIGGIPLMGFRLSAEQKKKVTETLQWADVVHAHGIWTPQAMRVTKVARAMHKPYVISLRGMLDDWCMDQRRTKKLAYLKLGGSRMLNRAALIHSTAEGELMQSKKWFPGSEGVVIPNLLNLQPFEQMPDPQIARDAFPFFDTGDPVLLYLSRIHYKKGIEHLIEAIKILRDEGLPHRLLIAGDGDKDYESRLRALTKTHGLEDHVAFLGLVVGDEKIALYQAADLFVLPTSQENFGFVIYEALAAGTTVLTTKGVDTWPELESQAQATICEQRDASIASAIKGLTSDPSALAEKGRVGRQWIFDQMHPDRIILEFERFYERAISEGSGGTL
jgi:glycosyltransferase involved in cell wall biosynthesis